MLSRAQNTFHHNPRLHGPVSSIFKDANQFLFYVLLKHMYRTVTTNHFTFKLILFPAKIWHVIFHLVTPQLVIMTAWIRFGIAECLTSRSSEFKVHQI